MHSIVLHSQRIAYYLEQLFERKGSISKPLDYFGRLYLVVLETKFL